MKRFKSLFVAVMCLLVFTLGACGDPAGDRDEITLWVYGDLETFKAYNAMVDEYNNTQGAKDNIYLNKINKPLVGYETLLQTSVNSSVGPDIFMVSERLFKNYSHLYEDMTDYFTDDKIEQMGVYENIVSRYHYDNENITSNSDDPLLGFPIENNTATMFYNIDALEAVGIKIISVEAEDMDAFNANTALKAELGIPTDMTVPSKGFFRSEKPYVFDGRLDGKSWTKPGSSEVLIFNNKIPMSWNEMDDIAMILTASGGKNSNSITDYGYYTEWWFNYGWSVGGNCLADLSGNGNWAFTLGDDTANYIVKDGCTFVATSGTTYTEGQTLSLSDKLGITTDAGISKNDNGTFSQNGNLLTVSSDVLQAENDNVLQELPSTREAFTRFTMLAGDGGINVSPYPSTFKSTTSINYFFSGKIGFLVERANAINSISTNAKFEFDIAPLPEYKEYENEYDAYDDTIAVKGTTAIHGDGAGLCVRKQSDVNKEKAMSVIEWLASYGGQEIWANTGFVPNVESVAKDFASSYTKVNNIATLVENIEKSNAGDWWYMRDKAWIDVWATPLNSDVRNGKMTLNAFFDKYISESNDALSAY